MLNNDLFKEVKEHVFKQFKETLPKGAVYHNYNHTLQVVNAAHEIALAEKLSDNDLEILLLAAWFHDVGFTLSHENHEENSKKIAAEYLNKKSFQKRRFPKFNR
mgnify:CR=1 FL=1